MISFKNFIKVGWGEWGIQGHFPVVKSCTQFFNHFPLSNLHQTLHTHSFPMTIHDFIKKFHKSWVGGVGHSRSLSSRQILYSIFQPLPINQSTPNFAYTLIPDDNT